MVQAVDNRFHEYRKSPNDIRFPQQRRAVCFLQKLDYKGRTERYRPDHSRLKFPQLLLAAAYLKTELPSIKLPLLSLHGTTDKATMPSGSQYFMDHAASTDKQLNLYEGYYHDLLNDKYNAIIIRDIIRWLNQRA